MLKYIYYMCLLTMIILAVSAEKGNCSELELKETFHSCGYYWIPDKGEALPETLKVEFRKSGDSDWRKGLDACFFRDDGTYRGSVVDLTENTSYELRLRTPEGKNVAAGTFRTWSSVVPVARTIDISERIHNGTVCISDQGTPDGWIRFTAPPGTVLDGDKSRNKSAIRIDGAEYVILDGLTIRGGPVNGIEVRNSRFVRILNCDIGGWGRPGKMAHFPRLYFDKKGNLINSDAGIVLADSNGVVVERCFIHDPRSPSTSWTYGHPVGPDAMFVNRLSQTVICYNDMIGTDERRWNDVIESGGNFSADGGFQRDADIYGNFFAFPEDDGIELDGGQMNIRMFDNKFEGGHCGISVTTCVRGPSYLFRNLIVNLGDSDGNTNVIFKDLYQRNHCGMVYYFHNTVVSDGNGFAGNTPPRRFGRNNVLYCGNVPCHAKVAPGGIDFDYDLLWSFKSGNQKTDCRGKNSLVAKPHFVDAWKGLWALRHDSPGVTGVEVSNFSRLAQNGEVAKGALPAGSRLAGPIRPLRIYPDRGQILFSSPFKTETVSVVVDKSYRGILKIRKNDSFDWFDVTPRQVTVKPGEQITFTINPVFSKIPRPGLYSGAFLISEENGLSAPVSVYLRKAGKEVDMTYPQNALLLDAARPTSGIPVIRKVSDALQGRAVSLCPESGGPLSWTFEISQAGEYHILLHCFAPEVRYSHNELFFSLDGAKPKELRLNLCADTWAWAGIPNPVKKGKALWVRSTMGRFHLTAGKHRIEIIPKEQLYLDRILITPDFQLMRGNINNQQKYSPVWLE